MATRKSAAEQELQKAEAEYVKLHPLAAKGNDVSPVTRGELRIILEDLLVQLGKAPAPAPEPVKEEPKKPEKPLTDKELNEMTVEQLKMVAKWNDLDVSQIATSDDPNLWREFIGLSMDLKYGSKP